MKTIILFILLFPFLTEGQTISTIAGNGVASNTGDGGLATAAKIDYPLGGMFDKNGNYYFTTGNSGHSIRKIDPVGNIFTVAGTTSVSGYSGDGALATNAKLNNPQYVAIDPFDNVYISDAINNRIRKITLSTGVITTFAGNGTAGYSGDNNIATNAMLNNPLGLSFDKSGNLYIADALNNVIRKVNTSGIITTVAGNGIPGHSVINGVAATSASILAYGLCSDTFSNIYIADGYGAVYKVNSNGIITYFAGTGTNGYSGDGGKATDAQVAPYLIAMDNYGNLAVCERDVHRIRIVNNAGYINTIVGNGVPGYSGDFGPANLAQVNYPGGVAFDSCSNLYITEGHGFRIRKVTYPHCNYLAVENEQHSPQNISLYPNPANDELHIDNLQNKTTYTLLNTVGQSIQHGILKAGSNSIALQTLARGIYVLQLTDEVGKRSVSRVIKQ